MSEAARVVALGIAAGAGLPMRRMTSVRLTAGRGIDGDRYASGQGYWSAWPDTELTLVESEVAESLGIEPLSLRRNVVTRDIALDRLIGQEFSMGNARLVGVRSCDPCRYLEEQVAHTGLKAALEGRGGLRARILHGGDVSVGDAIRTGARS